MYAAELIALIEDSGFSSHLYADDTQIYGSSQPAAVDEFSSKISECVGVVSSWMRSNRLQLNADKTEVIWCATSRRQHQLPTATLSIDGVPELPVPSVRNPGVFIDAYLVMRTHVRRTVSRCFVAFRQLRQIRRSVPTTTFKTLGGRFGLVPSGLWEQRTSRSSSLHGPPSLVGAKCSCAVDLQSTTLRPYHRCAGQSGGRCFQGRSSDIQSSLSDYLILLASQFVCVKGSY
jgi:hypothetical protein